MSLVGVNPYFILFFGSNEAENGEQNFQKKTGKILYTNIVIYLQHLNQVILKKN